MQAAISVLETGIFVVVVLAGTGVYQLAEKIVLVPDLSPTGGCERIVLVSETVVGQFVGLDYYGDLMFE